METKLDVGGRGGIVKVLEGLLGFLIRGVIGRGSLFLRGGLVVFFRVFDLEIRGLCLQEQSALVVFPDA